jgi:hypothetical protein
VIQVIQELVLQAFQVKKVYLEKMVHQVCLVLTVHLDCPENLDFLDSMVRKVTWVSRGWRVRMVYREYRVVKEKLETLVRPDYLE